MTSSARRAGAVRSGWTRSALAVGRLATRVSRASGIGEGGVIGGRVAMALGPGSLRALAADRRIALVTGTNGKTTTAHLLAAALRTAGPVAHNASGANMADGVAAALMADPRATHAVLEVDELHLPAVLEEVEPDVVVLLNLSRDQLDRGTEVAAVARVVRSALHEQQVVVANRDDPVVAALAADLPRAVWVSPGTGWTEDTGVCPRCGRRQAEDAGNCGCGSRPPAASWVLRDRTADGPHGSTPVRLHLPGRFNRGNAVMALAAADVMGVAPAAAAAAMAEVSAVAGRYDVVRHGGHRLRLLLAKNPAGWRATLPLTHGTGALLLAVNDREADGRDTSWLWDVPFEELPVMPTMACGDAAADLGLRLSYANVAHATLADPMSALELLPPGDVTVVANYTAFAGLRRLLAQPG